MKINSRNLELAFAKSEQTTIGISRNQGISNATVIKAKKGRDIRPDAVGRLARALGVTVEYLTEEV